MSTLKNALDMAKPSFFHILNTLKPDLVMYDFLQPWVPTMAASQNIPSVLFLTPGAAASCYLFHIGRKKPKPNARANSNENACHAIRSD